MYFLEKNWSLYIFHGTKNEKYVKEITKNMNEVYLINLNLENLSKHDYNNLLTSENFYQSIHCENILIFQIDTILRKEIPPKFMDFDFIGGAPWSLNINGWWAGMIGNGGLSFRKKSKMIEIIKREKYLGGNEDGYFAVFCKKFNYKIPDLETASSFSVETIFHPDPIGLHSPNINGFNIKDYEKLFDLTL